MKKGPLAAKAKRTLARSSGLSPSLGEVWSAFRRGLADALRALKDGEVLVVAAKGRSYFVRFAGHGTKGMRVEAVIDASLVGDARLSEHACQDLKAMGWRPQTDVPSTGAGGSMEGSPHFYLDARIPVPFARLASLVVRTLRTIYHVRHPDTLTCKSFRGEGGARRLPKLRIARTAAAPPRAEGAGAPSRGEDGVATGCFPEEDLFTWEDGKPVAADVVEATLVRRLAQCEAAFEDALWQLGRFYGMVGRYPEATNCFTWFARRTDDPEKQASGYLALGQLLERQENYAEAEASYAQGLAIGPAAGETGYFLHNNRGYCLNLLGRHDEAETHCRQAIALDPARHNAHKNLGLALAGQGRLTEAAQALLEADRRCPADPRARQRLRDLVRDHPEVLEADPALAVACREWAILSARAGNA